MMREFFIQIKDGQPFEHPIARENMQQLFPEHDLNLTIPDNFAVFERKQPPLTGPYERIDSHKYEWEEGIVVDVFTKRDLTPEEKFAQQETVKLNFQKYVGFTNWYLDEDTCTMMPPVPYPGNLDGTGPRYNWNDSLQEWYDVTDQPITEAPLKIVSE